MMLCFVFSFRNKHFQRELCLILLQLEIIYWHTMLIRLNRNVHFYITIFTSPKFKKGWPNLKYNNFKHSLEFKLLRILSVFVSLSFYATFEFLSQEAFLRVHVSSYVPVTLGWKISVTRKVSQHWSNFLIRRSFAAASKDYIITWI